MTESLEWARRHWLTWRRSTGRSTIFRGIRLRLTLWYTGVLAAALVLLGIALYVGVRQALLQPIDDRLQQQGQFAAAQWQLDPFRCPPANVDLYACYDQRGDLLFATLVGRAIGHFVDPSLASAASGSSPNSVVRTIDTTGGVGKVRLYVLAVSDGGGNSLGVIELGQPIGGQLDALNVLLTRLLIFGSLALIGAALGGIFLAGRALEPARLAYARQRDFIADASHELRTPLTLLRADAEVLLRGRERLDPDDAVILEDVVAETSHMTALANSMLNLAHLDSGNAPLEQDVVDLAAVATEIARRITALASEREVSVRVESEGPVLVVGDHVLLDQAALVLTDNAVKYNHPGGEVVLHAATRGEGAVLEVRDTGIGIAPEHLPHLGERFYRVDKARSREGGGAGLGVSIARSIATRHRGTLRLISEPGRGTTATLVLPSANDVRPRQ